MWVPNCEAEISRLELSKNNKKDLLFIKLIELNKTLGHIRMTISGEETLIQDTINSVVVQSLLIDKLIKDSFIYEIDGNMYEKFSTFLMSIKDENYRQSHRESSVPNLLSIKEIFINIFKEPFPFGENYKDLIPLRYLSGEFSQIGLLCEFMRLSLPEGDCFWKEYKDETNELMLFWEKSNDYKGDLTLKHHSYFIPVSVLRFFGISKDDMRIYSMECKKPVDILNYFTQKTEKGQLSLL